MCKLDSYSGPGYRPHLGNSRLIHRDIIRLPCSAWPYNFGGFFLNIFNRYNISICHILQAGESESEIKSKAHVELCS